DFVLEHRALVVAAATRVQREMYLSVPMDDLIQFGYAGLLDARRRYEPDKGVHFSAFATYRVQGAILDDVRKMAYLPRRAYQRMRALEAADVLNETLGETRAGDPRGRGDVRRSLEDLDGALAKMSAGYVLAAAGQADDPQDGSGSPERRLMEGQARAQVRAALDHLPERERALVEGHYFEGRRFDEVAEEL